MEATKFDSDKIRYDLIPEYGLEEVAKIYAHGAQKYEDYNWKQGTKWSRIYAAMLRHLQAYKKGEILDSESKCHHLSSVIWCAMTLMEYQRLGLGEDDRPCVSDMSIEYAAGLLDSEGSIVISLNKKKNDHSLMVHITNTNDIPLNKGKNKWGGTVHLKTNNKLKRKPCFVWVLQGKTAENFLLSVLPFLRIKKEQALLAIEFQSTKIYSGKKIVPEDIYKYREGIKLKISNLNQGITYDASI